MEVIDITNPRFNEQISLVPLHFVKSRFHCMQIKLIFIGKDVHLASLWEWEFLELESGLFNTFFFSFIFRRKKLWPVGYAYRSQANPQPPDISESPLQGMVCCQGAHLKEQAVP